MSVVGHLSDARRRRSRRMEALDTALDAVLDEMDASQGRFDPELAAARALAMVADAEAVPGEALVALRAGLAARASRTHAQRGRRPLWAQMGMSGAVAASFVGLLAYVGLTGGDARPPIASLRGATDAAATLKIINQRMAQVQVQVASGNKPAAVTTGQSAGEALIYAQQYAGQLPDGSALRQVLLADATSEIASLQALLGQLQLQLRLPAPSSHGVLGAVVVAPAEASTLLSAPTLALAPSRSGSGGTSATSASSSTNGPTSTTAPDTTTTTMTVPKPTTTTTTTVPKPTTTTTTLAPTTTTTTQVGSGSTTSTTGGPVPSGSGTSGGGSTGPHTHHLP